MIDIEQPQQLLAYLRHTRRIGAREEPALQVLPGGVSNRVVLVQRPSGEAWVVKQALRRLRVPVEWYSGPERSHTEALGLQWLARLAPPGTSPAFVFEDPTQYIVTAQAVPTPHVQWREQLLAGQVQPALCEQAGQLLGTLQRVSHARREDLAVPFHDRSFFETLRIEPYYIYTWSQTPAAGAFFDALISETRARRQVLVHGDYSPKNMLIHAGRLVLIDHEVIHLGDPAFDPGFMLAHLLSKANHLAAQRSALAAGALRFWQAYHDQLGTTPWGGGLEARVVRHTLGVLLARVVGRSQLAYLTSEGRRRQQAAALALIADLPTSVAALTERYTAALNASTTA